MALYLKIKRLIEKNRRLQQKDLADALGVTGKTAHNYLNGHTKISADQVPAIAKLLGLTIEELYREDKEYNKKTDSMIGFEPQTKFDCSECVAKQKEIDALKEVLSAKEELLEIYRHKHKK